jgi:predicted PurR-regulated permease PerM
MATPNTARWVLICLVALALVLAVRVVQPFLTAFFIASVLAAALSPPTRRLARLLGGRRRLAAGLTTVTLVVAAVIPLGTLGAVLVKEIVDGVAWIRQALQSQGIAGLVERLPHWMQSTAQRLLDAIPHGAQNLQELVTQQGAGAAAAVGGVLTATGAAVLHTTLMLIAFFFLLVDGRALVEWLKESVPLKRGQMAELLEEFRKVTVAVLLSVLVTAGVQALLGLVGFLVAGVPNVVFFTVLTFVMALVPLVGGTVVVVAIGLLLFFTGHRLAGAYLVAWGVFLVGMVDNVVKPLVIRGGVEIHGAIVFFALLGGLAAFGPIGLVAGPLSVSFLIAVLRMYRRDYGESQ